MTKLSNSIIVYKQNGIRTVASGATKPSQNAKTGDMLQVSHLVDKIKPTTAIKEKKDVKICGNCPLKGAACYVNPLGLNASFRATTNQKTTGIPDINKSVRFGAYGDTAIGLPLPMAKKWVTTLKRKKLIAVGYTHQWLTALKGWNRYLMASIDPLSAKQEGITDIQLKNKANAKGYRTYRISLDGSDLQADEILCPNITHGTQCVDCGLCDGSRGSSDKRKNIVSILHGSPAGISTTLKKLKG